MPADCRATPPPPPRDMHMSAIVRIDSGRLPAPIDERAADEFERLQDAYATRELIAFAWRDLESDRRARVRAERDAAVLEELREIIADRPRRRP